MMYEELLGNICDFVLSRKGYAKKMFCICRAATKHYMNMLRYMVCLLRSTYKVLYAIGKKDYLP